MCSAQLRLYSVAHHHFPTCDSWFSFTWTFNTSVFVVMSMVGVVGGCGCGYVGPGGVVCLVGFVYLVVLDLLDPHCSCCILCSKSLMSHALIAGSSCSHSFQRKLKYFILCNNSFPQWVSLAVRFSLRGSKIGEKQEPKSNSDQQLLTVSSPTCSNTPVDRAAKVN